MLVEERRIIKCRKLSKEEVSFLLLEGVSQKQGEKNHLDNIHERSCACLLSQKCGCLSS
jgi:hypothetical protein